MIGMDRKTGKRIEGRAHLEQSIDDILSTPIGTRVMRREYGSDLRRLVDAGIDPAIRLTATASTGMAIEKWEPQRYRFRRLDVSAAPGKLDLTLHGDYLPEGQPVTIEGIEIA